MVKRCVGTTYVTVKVVNGDERAAIDYLYTQAAERLGGADGILLVNIVPVDFETLAGTFSRWEEEPADVDETQAVEPAQSSDGSEPLT